MNIFEFRQQYPQYNDINDIDLAKSLHKKSYSDMKFEDFTKSFLTSKPTVQNDVQTQQGSNAIYSEPIPPEAEEAYRQTQWMNEQVKLGNIKPTQGFWDKMKQESFEMIGGEVGALAGARAGAMAGARIGQPQLRALAVPAGAVAGAFLGGMAGKGTQQLYRVVGQDEPMTQEQILSELYTAGKSQAIGELAGRGIGKVIGKVAAPFKNAVLPSTTRLSKKLQEVSSRIPPNELTEYAQKVLKQSGAFLTGAQRTESRFLDFVESATESSIFGGNRMYQVKRILNPAAYDQIAKEMSDTFWKEAGRKLSPEEVGNLFIDTISGKRQVQKRLERVAYGQVDQLLKTSGKVDLRPIKMAAEKMYEQSAKSNLGSSKYIKTITAKIKNWDDFSDTFMDAHALRSDMLEEVRNMELSGNIKLPKVHRQLDILSGLIDKSMSESAKKVSPDAYDAWRAANKLTKSGAEILNNDVINNAIKLAQTNPEKVSAKVFTQNGTKTLKVVKKAVDDKTYNTLLASYMDNLMETQPGSEAVLGKTFKRRLMALGEDMHKEMFTSPEHYQNVMDIADLADIIKAPTGGGGGIIASITQAGAIVSAATGIGMIVQGKDSNIQRGAGVILLGPAILGRIMSTPTGAKWLSEGLKTQNPKVWNNVPPAVVRILKGAYNANKVEESKSYIEQTRGFGGRGY